MNIYKNMLAIGMIIITIAGNGQEDTIREDTETLRLSVADAQKYAIENNRTVQSSKIDIELAKKKIWETTAIGLPQVSVSADYQHNFSVPEMSFGPYLDFTGIANNPTVSGADLLNSYRESEPIELGVKDNTTINLTVSQLIFSGEYIVGLQASRVYKEISDKNYVKSEQTTKESVATSYYIILVLSENKKVLEESIKLIDQTYKDITGMYEVGFVEETDVDQMKINKSNLQTLINSLQGQKSIAEMLLKMQLGVGFEQNIVLTDSLTGLIDEGNTKYLASIEFDVEQSVDFELMKTQEKLMQLNLRREKSKFLPTLAAYYRHQELTSKPEFNFQPKDVIGASLNLPIFTSFQRISTLKQAKLNLAKVQLTKEDVRQGLELEYEKARNDYETALKNYLTNKESMELTQKIYNKSIIKFKEGVGTSLELTQNQNQFLTSESNYYNSLMALLNAKAHLEKVIYKYENSNN